MKINVGELTGASFKSSSVECVWLNKFTCLAQWFFFLKNSNV